MAKESLENEKIDELKSPKQLGTYVHATRPMVWLVLTAITALVVAFLVWAFNGYIVIEQPIKVFSHEGQSFCLVPLEESWQIKEGQVVVTSTSNGVVTGKGSNPISYDDVYGVLGERFTEQLSISLHKAYYPVFIELEKSVPDHVVDGSVLLGSIRPIAILFNSGSGYE